MRRLGKELGSAMGGNILKMVGKKKGGQQQRAREGGERELLVQLKAAPLPSPSSSTSAPPCCHQVRYFNKLMVSALICNPPFSCFEFCIPRDPLLLCVCWRSGMIVAINVFVVLLLLIVSSFFFFLPFFYLFCCCGSFFFFFLFIYLFIEVGDLSSVALSLFFFCPLMFLI